MSWDFTRLSTLVQVAQAATKSVSASLESTIDRAIGVQSPSKPATAPADAAAAAGAGARQPAPAAAVAAAPDAEPDATDPDAAATVAAAAAESEAPVEEEARSPSPMMAGAHGPTARRLSLSAEDAVDAPVAAGAADEEPPAADGRGDWVDGGDSLDSLVHGGHAPPAVPAVEPAGTAAAGGPEASVETPALASFVHEVPAGDAVADPPRRVDSAPPSQGAAETPTPEPGGAAAESAPAPAAAAAADSAVAVAAAGAPPVSAAAEQDTLSETSRSVTPLTTPSRGGAARPSTTEEYEAALAYARRAC